LFLGIGKSIQNCRSVRQPVPVYADKSSDPVCSVWCTFWVTWVQVEVAQNQNQIEELMYKLGEQITC